MSILVVIIFITVLKRSWPSFNESRDSLLTNKWRSISRELFSIVLYPIVNTILVVIYFTVAHYSIEHEELNFIFRLPSSLGLMTSIMVMLHLCTLKCKKRKDVKKKAYRFCVIPNNHNDVFTSETVASTNARTTYQFTRTSSINVDGLDLVASNIN